MMTIQSIGASTAIISDVKSLKWQHRIIIVYTQAPDQYAAVLRQFQDAQAQIDERDIVWFIDTGDNILSNAEKPLAPDFSQSLRPYDNRRAKEPFAAVLLGKDGGVKQRQSTLNLSSFMALIDTMPMRQWEMLTRR